MVLFGFDRSHLTSGSSVPHRLGQFFLVLVPRQLLFHVGKIPMFTAMI